MKHSSLPHLLAQAMDADIQRVGPITYSATLQTPAFALTLARDMRTRGILVHTDPFEPTRIYYSDVSVPTQPTGK